MNCAIEPLVSLHSWPYEKSSGLGGSAAWAALNGENCLRSELDLGVGWQVGMPRAKLEDLCCDRILPS